MIEWKDIIPALAQSYTVIVPDLRGAGLSDKPVKGYDKLTLAKDIYLLVEQLGFKEVSLVGHDIGAMVAFTYANEYSEETAAGLIAIQVFQSETDIVVADFVMLNVGLLLLMFAISVISFFFSSYCNLTKNSLAFGAAISIAFFLFQLMIALMYLVTSQLMHYLIQLLF
ncbi:alpha/beta fold hydrolase [Psychrobacillus sp. INOP01]|uniref:alpha/beta fold hydrolase n=1 Tax=Psychrobacillus sp. INOP01 TaxID=2829187 RepID=UPI001BA644E3|nr:alpha/beta fold hydrolase [Psychrobacillus sp. INOP01]QUG41934.1 alpha/beta fold hydrolase [Psychrobacillus sp. INOP01]